MFLVLGFCVIAVITTVAIIRSKKPLKVILAEAKIELLYNAVGSRAILEDFVMRKKNKTELPKMTGKIAVVTGGNRGIGREIVRMFLKCNMTVVIGCRNIQQAEFMVQIFRDEGVESGIVDIYPLDISVMESVRNFANKIKEKYPKIHYVVNNAGIMFGPYVESKDGYESQLATNYLGHFLLIHLLLPNIKAGGQKTEFSRIVNVSSCAHVLGHINFEDINNRKQYIAGESYAQSKLAQVLFSNHLDELFRSEKAFVQALSVHPGIVNTDLFNDTPLKKAIPWLPQLFFKNPEQGATPIVHACLSKKLEGRGGTYIHNCRIFPASELTKSKELQEKLFDFTLKLLKIDEFGK